MAQIPPSPIHKPLSSIDASSSLTTHSSKDRSYHNTSSNQLQQHVNANNTDSDAETEVAEDDIIRNEDEEEDEEDRYWHEFQRRHRNKNATSKRHQSVASSASSTSSTNSNAAVSEASDEDETAKSDDEDEIRMGRKRKHHRLTSSTRGRRKASTTEHTPEKRRRGRPRKDSSSTTQDDDDKTTVTRKKPRGRTACQDPNKPDKAGRTKLFVFTGAGNLEKVKELVSRGANVNFRDNAGWTPLHEASLKGQHDTAQYLVSCGANVNARGFNDDTPLHDASSNGFPACVQLLVDAGADVFALNSDKETPLDVCEDDACRVILENKMKQLNRLVAKDDNGRTILHRACASGQYDEVAILLKQGANANAQDNELWTPLHEAAHHGHLEIAKLLIQHGADYNYFGNKGYTALHHASAGGHKDLVQYLLDTGADVDLCNHAGENAYQVATAAEPRRILAARIDELRKQRTASDAIDEITFISHTKQRRHRPESNTATNSRPLSREERKIQAIMRTFASIEQNKRPRRSRNRHDEMDDDEEAIVQKEDGRRRRRIHSTSSSNTSTTTRRRQKSISAEVEASSREPSLDPESTTTEKMTRSVAKKVDASKLDPFKKDTSGRTHLHKWAIKGDLTVVSTLLKSGANPNESDNAGWTPLHEAALRGRDQVVLLLLENGADPNSKGADQDTALHDAVENGHANVIEHLLKFGANPRAKNSKGLTPLDIASENNDPHIESILRRTVVKSGKRKATDEANDDDSRKRIKDEEESPREEDAKVPATEKAKAHARELSGRHLPKKTLHPLQQPQQHLSGGDLSPDGPHTPIPTPPPEHWHTKVKEEKDYSSLSSLLLAPSRDRAPTLMEAQRYLPLYTVQLFEETARKLCFFVVDFQISMLLGLSTQSFWQRYPYLCQRPVTDKEKERLWSPFASMLCQGNISKQTEKQRFNDTDMHFVLLEQVVSVIKQDYDHLSQSLITITLDIGYKDENSEHHPSTPIQPQQSTPHCLLNNNHVAMLPKRPGCGLPPKVSLKLQKFKK